MEHHIIYQTEDQNSDACDRTITFVTSEPYIENSTNEVSYPEDEEDIFQCGRCKSKFNSLALFVKHKQDCSSTSTSTQIRLNVISESENKDESPDTQLKPRGEVIQYLGTPSHTSQEVLEVLEEQEVVTTINGEDDQSSVIFKTDDNISLTIQQGATLSFGNDDTQVLTVSENDLTTLLTSGQSYHITSINQGVDDYPTQSIILTTLTTDQFSNVDQSFEENEDGIKKLNSNINRPKSKKKYNKDKSELIEDGKNIKKNDNQIQNKGENRCKFCNKVFAKPNNLQQHLRAHTGEKPFHCIICARGFTQKSNVKKHMQTHKIWPKMKSTLPKNQISIIVKDDVEGVVENDYLISQDGKEDKKGEVDVQLIVNNIYVCNYCEESSFENYSQLKSHMNKHKNEKLFKCNVKDCAYTFQEVEDLIQHLKIHEMEYNCEQCPKVCKSFAELTSHSSSHRLYPNKERKGAEKNIFICPKCNNKFASQESLNHHLINTSHSYTCQQCKITFVCERYLRRHIKIHGTINLFSCTQCGKSFKTENYLKNHSIIHSNLKPFKCELCLLSFNRKDKLVRHKLIHDKMKSFNCPFKNIGCTKEFYRKDKLKDHLLSHATCSSCKKIFKSKHHLNIHTCKPDESIKNSNSHNNKRRLKKSHRRKDENYSDDDNEENEQVLYADCEMDNSINGSAVDNSINEEDTILSFNNNEEEILTRYDSDQEVEAVEVVSHENVLTLSSTIDMTYVSKVDGIDKIKLMAGD